MFKTNKTLISASLTLALVACGQKSTEEHLKLAQTHIENNDSNAAVIELKNAIKLDEKHIQSRVLLGKTYLDLGLMQNAEKEFLKAIELSPTPKTIAPLLLESLHYQDKNKEIIELYNQYSNDGDFVDSEEFKLYAAISYFVRNHKEKSSQLFTSIINNNEASKRTADLAQIYLSIINNDTDSAFSLVRNYTTSYEESLLGLFLQGQLARFKRDYSLTITTFKDYLAIFPQDNKARIYLADAYYKNKQLNKAEQQLNKLLKSMPEQPFINQLKGTIAFVNEDFEVAKSSLEKSIQNNLDDASTRLLAGVASFKLENYEQSYRHLTAISDQISDSHPAKKLLILVQLKLGYNLEAAQSLESIENLSNKDIQLFTMASYELLKDGDVKSARSLVDKASELDTNTPEDLIKLGALKLSLEDVSGIANLESALQSDSNLPLAKQALIRAYVTSGQLDKAIELIDEWIIQEPDFLVPYNLAANVWKLKGESEKAIPYLEKALSISSQDAFSLSFLATLDFDAGNTDSALAQLRSLLEQKPDYLPGLVNYYLFSRTVGKQQDAINKLKNARNKNKQDLAYLLTYAKALLNEQQPKGVLTILSDIEFDHSTSEDLWVLKSESHIKLREVKESRQFIDAWKASKPKSVKAQLQSIRVHELNKKYDRALNELVKLRLQTGDSNKLYALEAYYLSLLNQPVRAKSVMKQIPDSYQESPVKETLGRISFLNREFTSAANYFEQAYKDLATPQLTMMYYQSMVASNQKTKGLSFLEQHLVQFPKDIQTRIIAANEYMLKEPEKALHHYEAVLPYQKSNIVVLNNLAWLLLKSDTRKQDAVKFARQASELAPNNAQILDTYGTALIGVKNKSEAIAVLSKALGLAPNNKSIANNLEKAKKM